MLACNSKDYDSINRKSWKRKDKNIKSNKNGINKKSLAYYSSITIKIIGIAKINDKR